VAKLIALTFISNCNCRADVIVVVEILVITRCTLIIHLRSFKIIWLKQQQQQLPQIARPCCHGCYVLSFARSLLPLPLILIRSFVVIVIIFAGSFRFRAYLPNE